MFDYSPNFRCYRDTENNVHLVTNACAHTAIYKHAVHRTLACLHDTSLDLQSLARFLPESPASRLICDT